VLLVFALAIFVSATLLFLVQPMFTKMVLPLLGGAPGVWNTCLVFYQAALLTGYAYAHVAPRYLGVRRQAVFHVALLILIVFTLPIGISHGWTPPPTSNPVLWLLLLLSVSVGLPFFVISTTAPLLQKWFAHTGHAHAHDPYFLYGASNLGSLLALMCYPVLVEPYLRLGHQAWVWAGGYLLLIGLISLCALMLWRSAGAAPELAETLAAAAPFQPAAPPLTLSQRCWWVLLAFAPSSLLLGVTSYISTDIASVPLLWVVPLALYILTFVLVFARRPLLPHRLMLFLEPYLIIPVAITFFLPMKGILLLPLYLLTFFMIAMVCHGELMKARPPASQLTEFYLWMSVGGVLGGVFNALVAPMVFNSVIEFPLIIVLACLLRPGQASEAGKSNNQLEDYLRPLLFAVTLAGIAWGLKGLPNQWQTLAKVLVACLVGVICYSFRLQPRRFALGVGVLILSGLWFQPGSNRVLLRERNFFGVLKVTLSGDGQYHVLHHGTTLHGSQSLDPARRREPLSYYYRLGPLGQVFAAYEGKDAKKKVAIVGLGTGTVACYAQPGQQFTFYEIDPAVERIARDPRYFTFLQDCPAKYEVVLGDARLSLQQAPDSCYDMIILDAFSSDAIPVHLMTREALALYRAKLNKGGILLFHISNRYLDLKPVLGALARDAGWISLCQSDVKMTIKELVEQKKSSDWVVMARDLDDLARLAPGIRWQSLSGTTREVLWTDDFSNILAVFKKLGRK
jgi:spermidine synthase